MLVSTAQPSDEKCHRRVFFVKHETELHDEFRYFMDVKHSCSYYDWTKHLFRSVLFTVKSHKVSRFVDRIEYFNRRFPPSQSIKFYKFSSSNSFVVTVCSTTPSDLTTHPRYIKFGEMKAIGNDPKHDVMYSEWTRRLPETEIMQDFRASKKPKTEKPDDDEVMIIGVTKDQTRPTAPVPSYFEAPSAPAKKAFNLVAPSYVQNAAQAAILAANLAAAKQAAQNAAQNAARQAAAEANARDAAAREAAAHLAAQNAVQAAQAASKVAAQAAAQVTQGQAAAQVTQSQPVKATLAPPAAAATQAWPVVQGYLAPPPDVASFGPPPSVTNFVPWQTFVAMRDAKDAELRMKNEALAERDAVIRAKDAIIAAKDAELGMKNDALADKDTVIRAKDALIAVKDELLRARDETIAAMSLASGLAPPALAARRA